MLLQLLVHKILYLVKLIDKKLYMKKRIHLLSNGSIYFLPSLFKFGKELITHPKDYNNLFLNQKNKTLYIKSSTFLTGYKQQYFK